MGDHVISKITRALELGLRGRANSLSKMETGRLQMKYLFPRGAIDISVYLKKFSVHAILSRSDGMKKVVSCEEFFCSLSIRGVTAPAMLV